ncbi:MAG: SAM-dependent methyltransferase [Chthoniobacteraceae bacterium]|nr:SAM-dependent methyltransferase [Chthoniobacteraceae bacterium]
MAPLAEILRAEIASGGPMPFRRFMERALYDPAHGYYAAGRAAIGREGDFFTSVSVGPLFGRLLAVQFGEMWERLGRPARFDVVEQGGAGGEFAGDVLRAAEARPEFAAALRYRLVEPFPGNAARQRERLAEFAGRVTWHASLEALPPFTGVHFSNELVDAFPVHRVVFRAGAWRERYVAAGADGRFGWEDGPLSTPGLAAYLRPLPALEGYETEVNAEAAPWLEAVAARLKRGYVLLADYGFARADYYLPERAGGTLAAYCQHRRSDDPLDDPGARDLTAHVDFTTLAEHGMAAGLALAGFTDQHHFLAALGRRVFPDVTDPRELTPLRRKEMRAFATLVHPGLMGRDFHFLAFAKGAETALDGYSLAADPAKRLGLAALAR